MKLQKNVLDINEQAITQAPKEEREELYKTHDAIVNFINEQTYVIQILSVNITNMYSREYVKDLNNLIQKQRKYIEVLGGNPSNINFIKMQDLKEC
jgi:uncharacterized protein Yka (UPF0111/DUF47 family)